MYIVRPATGPGIAAGVVLGIKTPLSVAFTSNIADGSGIPIPPLASMPTPSPDGVPVPDAAETAFDGIRRHEEPL